MVLSKDDLLGDLQVISAETALGDLIRPEIADVRERLTYNRLVGAGTYIFRLNKDWCVDATRAGNMAHLLNHSCEPNCLSRTISARHPVTGNIADHVVIFAKRDIHAGEELTYDYRFCGEEQLRCNCGSTQCRGLVNEPEKRAAARASE
ncbi:hypothetical protein DUNSADRAFT_6749 [Dunaliella salina]|uniref:Uncharacterized protein n=1 Tax=Dunaliella salina TaxID=3046 RepID=A0ABQ7H6L9_DUNSA|nr:hypothetical protein DUNSADRAFT_6749 [Dunaliella salina]|eukprot:KAF5842505.1 hypothetical protein DUNSADRAFT_6749 [Dunaliella salina]